MLFGRNGSQKSPYTRIAYGCRRQTLGLSEVIQRNAGGVKLESMFVDEGFGVLDNESLEQAIEVLNSLSESDRMVGIISHISELKDRIDKKIVVKKGSAGSTVELIN